MDKDKVTSNNTTATLVKALYVVAAVIAVIFVYMFIVNVIYIVSYMGSYDMSFSDMGMEAVQYVITGSISYFVYALLVFCAAKILGILGCGITAEEDASKDVACEKAAAAAESEVKRPDRPRKQHKKRR